MTRRITIPAGHKALIVSDQLADELLSLARQLRGPNKRVMLEEGHKTVAGDLILAIVEGQQP